MPNRSAKRFDPFRANFVPGHSFGAGKSQVILTGVILMLIAVFAALSVIVVQHFLASMFLVGLG
jgi:hypothetical protein